MLKVIPSSETTLSVEWVTPVILLPHPNPYVFTLSRTRDSGISFRPYQALVWVPFLTSASLSDSTSQVASLDPPTDLWPHSFLCPLSLKVQDFWAPQVAV